jgi:hypothetical protein
MNVPALISTLQKPTKHAVEYSGEKIIPSELLQLLQFLTVDTLPVAAISHRSPLYITFTICAALLT